MQVSDVKNPAERNKVIGAAVLGLVAILLLWWTFFGFGGSSTPTQRRPTGPTTQANRQPAPVQSSTQPQSVVEIQGDLLDRLAPVSYTSIVVSVPAVKRNIFAFVEAPPPQVVTSTP